MDERIALASGTIINNKYQIYKEIGRGGSCIVYDATYEDESGYEHHVRAKEFYPYLSQITRVDNQLCILADIEKYNEIKERFIKAYERNLKFLADEKLINSTVDAREIIEANNTLYVIYSCDGGTTLDRYTPISLRECAKIVLAVSKAIKRYHDMGYLHLDIKPANIFILDGSRDLVVMFDFDSVCSMDELKAGEINRVSYSEGYAAPEQVQGRFTRITEATDIYAVGSLFYEKIFGHLPCYFNRNYSSEFDFSELLYPSEAYDNNLYNELSDFLKKTLASSIARRYQSMDLVCEHLSKIIELSNVRKQVIKGSFIDKSYYFVGRDTELQEISDFLHDGNTVVLSGIGGIGKSTLAIEYAKRNKSNYNLVIFANFGNGIVDFLLDELKITITNFSRLDKETDREYARRKLGKLKELCNEKILVIIDNIDEKIEDDTDIWNDFMQLDCHKIITSRMRTWNYNTLRVDVIRDKKDLLLLFNKYCAADSQDIYPVKLIEYVHGLTVAVELLAKQIFASHITPQAMYERLTEGTIMASGDEKIKMSEELAANKKAVEHLQSIFDVSELSKAQCSVLFTMTFAVETGCTLTMLKLLSGKNDYNVINNLEELGWIKISGEYVFIHPLVAEAVRDSACDKCDITKVCRRISKYIMENIYVIENDERKILDAISTGCINWLIDKGIDEECLFELVSKRMDHFVAIKNFAFDSKCYDYTLCSSTCNKEDKFNITYYYAWDLIRIGKIEDAMKISLLLSELSECEDDKQSIRHKAVEYSIQSRIARAEGKNEKALDLQEKCIEAYRAIYGSQYSRMVGNTSRLINLYSINGNIDKAIEISEDAIKDLEENNVEPLKILPIYDAYAKLLTKKCDFVHAKKVFINNLELVQKYRGLDYIDIPGMCNLIALTEMRMCKYDDAERHLLEALEFEEMYEAKPDVIMYSFEHLVKLYRRIKDYNKAAYYCNAALEYIDSNNFVNSNKAGLLSERSSIARMRMKYVEAIGDAEAVLNLRIEKFGMHHKHTASAYLELGKSYIHYDDFRAELIIKKALNIIQDCNEQSSVLCSEIYENLVELYISMNQNDKALDAIKKSWNIYKGLDIDNYWLITEIGEQLDKLKSLYPNLDDLCNEVESRYHLVSRLYTEDV